MSVQKLILIVGLFAIAPLFGQNSTPCNCCTENHKAFDFWIGDWTVSNATNGAPAGTSKIRQEEGGCVIRENWVSASSGYTGTSLNFYNATAERWEQLWIDNSGAYLKLKGNRTGNKMILASDPFDKDGKKLVNRITWTANEDGTVRQLWEILEGDKVINTAFDGLYKKE
ncbi:hypothetical protein [Flagellimonas myxillae]|uniref:hypothetical protein n=1 Tax=Flagellimonas myxillae TaxID=2942214 RepID=UPI00201F4900|nr:hypothetical protein [Muricauda myxillae]MCL6265190.1 hypothetical protein [Muricauda myxillae]